MMHRLTTCCAALALLLPIAGCSGGNARYDDHARAADPAMPGPDAPAGDATPDTENPMADPSTDRDAALAAYNAALMDDDPKVELTDAQWRAILSDEEFRILRRSGTEYAGTGRYLDNEDPGSYHCAGCGLYLYDAKHKFHSGCGWPSFNQEVGDGVLTYVRDTSHGMVRTEMRCARCDGHMGHVFNDAPDQPTGIRHCVNGGAIIFVPEGQDPQDVIARHREQHAHR
jgi:peptide-methionine (R)-S-oxide reductase